MQHELVHPPRRWPPGRAGRVNRFAQGETAVGGTAGSAVVWNESEHHLG